LTGDVQDVDTLVEIFSSSYKIWSADGIFTEVEPESIASGYSSARSFDAAMARCFMIGMGVNRVNTKQSKSWLNIPINMNGISMECCMGCPICEDMIRLVSWQEFEGLCGPQASPCTLHCTTGPDASDFARHTETLHGLVWKWEPENRCKMMRKPWIFSLFR